MSGEPTLHRVNRNELSPWTARLVNWLSPDLPHPLFRSSQVRHIASRLNLSLLPAGLFSSLNTQALLSVAIRPRLPSNQGTNPSEAIRVDDKTGVKETFAFVGDRVDRLACMTHIPAGEVRGGLVICSSILSDFQRNYRTEVVMSRLLAQRGIAVQRFHYRGTGNSDGSVHETTFDSMQEDTANAVEHLKEVIALQHIALMGTRMGALVAAAESVKHPGSPLILLEPIQEASTFFSGSFEAQLLVRMSRDGLSRMTEQELLSELQTKHFVDIVGFTLTSALYNSTSQVLLDELLPMDPRPVLLAQLGGSTLSSEHLDLLDSLPPSGMAEHIVLPAGETWWFIEEGGEGAKERRPPDEAASEIAHWLVRATGSA